MSINRRFDERATVKKMMESSKEYITDEDIESILSERNDWLDYTFKFTQRGTGWTTKVYDNTLKQEVKMDDLNPFATEYFIRQILDLTKQKYLAPEELSKAM